MEAIKFFLSCVDVFFVFYLIGYRDRKSVV